MIRTSRPAAKSAARTGSGIVLAQAYDQERVLGPEVREEPDPTAEDTESPPLRQHRSVRHTSCVTCSNISTEIDRNALE